MNHQQTTLSQVSMRFTGLLSTLLVGLTFLGQTATAQESAVEESQQLYDVEIVIFSRQGAGAGSTESWPDDPGTPDWSNAVVLGNNDVSMVPGASLFELLPPEAHLLSAEKRQLRRSGGRLQSLTHIAWRQPGFPREQALPVYVRSAQKTDFDQPLMEGVVIISLGRYLHANLDLLLRPQYNIISSGEPPFDPGSTGHRFQGHRKMRSGELHYLDHPLMGALITIEKYEEPEPELMTEEMPIDVEAPAQEISTESPPVKSGATAQ
ncbi:CsiV family protein [Solemya velesiana gill symbiont]|nr:CsiV family protein [Solemya velesiana gill symbiont]